MSASSAKQWNPKYLAGCIQHTVELLGSSGGVVGDLLLDAATHLESTDTHDCRFYRQMLRQRANRVRRTRPIRSWEYWLLSAAEQILQPIPGVKHSAVTMLRTAIDEYNVELGRAWQEWYQQHTVKEPAYV